MTQRRCRRGSPFAEVRTESLSQGLGPQARAGSLEPLSARDTIAPVSTSEGYRLMTVSMPKRAQLVCQQLENISREALGKYHAIIRQYIRGRNGVYALYKGDKLYYVGLATNLRGRLKQHLRGRHGESWDRFSVYLTLGDTHLKEMESLLLRITKPVGNKQIGRFVSCDNLKKRFAGDIRSMHREELNAIIGRVVPAPDDRPAVDAKGNRPVLAIYIHKRTRLRGRYKGTLYRAHVINNGSIRFAGKTYNSPSLAASAVTGRPTNGWWFWHYERAPGDWVRLRELRS
jgi:hypothetical protein